MLPFGLKVKLMLESHNFVLFRTDLFVFEQQEKDIDRWFVGGDCAGWFYTRLLPIDCIRKDVEPIMEDWGWTFAVSVNEVRVWVNVWAYKVDNCWLFGVEARKRFLRRDTTHTLERAKNVVCDALENVLTVDPRFSKYRWYAENPFDLDIREF